MAAPALAVLVSCSGRVRGDDAGAPDGQAVDAQGSAPVPGLGCEPPVPTPEDALMPCGLPEVRFSAGEDELDAVARCKIIAATPCLIARGELVYLNAHASVDEAKGAEAALLLTDRRGEAVRRLLIEQGVPSGMIQVISKGNHETTGSANQPNRRVQLRLGGKPGEPVDLCSADRDCDGVDLPADRCPQDRELHNGVDDDDGCPDVGPFGIRLTARGHLVFDTPIVFKPGTATLDPASSPLLDALATVLLHNMHFWTVTIDVDPVGERGTPEALTRLADDRRVAIEVALVDRGVPAWRIPVRRGDDLTRPFTRDPEDGAVVIRTARAPEMHRANFLHCGCEYTTSP